jgi:SAM-dependent methyltransferase
MAWTSRPTPACAVCGGTTFTDRAVLWDALAEGWGITPEERRIVDRQQGTCCSGCGGNLRSLALAEAILAERGAAGTLQDFVGSDAARGFDLLEINEAGTLSPTLALLPGRRFAAYPELDMQAMHHADASFDMIVHSDTLEHVPDPARALAECARVLRPDGALCFTVPVLPGRLSTSRGGLPPLHHGDPANPTEDLLVHTDYGADVWHALHEAGFGTVTLTRFGDGLAITARTALRRTTPPAPQPDAALASKAAQLDAVLSSTSWRITAPLRRLAALLRH